MYIVQCLLSYIDVKILTHFDVVPKCQFNTLFAYLVEGHLVPRHHMLLAIKVKNLSQALLLHSRNVHNLLLSTTWRLLRLK